MARSVERTAGNAPGDWFVDTRCIDCGHCRVVAPDVFDEGPQHAFVARQPADPTRAARALVGCPVGSIGTAADVDLRAATRTLPEPVLPGVYRCGLASEATFGATSWLVVREGGNVMIDVPRPIPALLDRIDALGGVRWLFLTHRDDIAGHERIGARFGAERILHRGDANAVPGGVERWIDGLAPVDLAPDLRVIPTPGHTRGSACLLHRDVLFTGDSLWGRTRSGWAGGGEVVGLTAGREVAWASWPEQLRSLARLRGCGAKHVLPGHGRPWSGDFDVALDAMLRDVARA